MPQIQLGRAESRPVAVRGRSPCSCPVDHSLLPALNSTGSYSKSLYRDSTLYRHFIFSQIRSRVPSGGTALSWTAVQRSRGCGRDPVGMTWCTLRRELPLGLCAVCGGPAAHRWVTFSLPSRSFAALSPALPALSLHDFFVTSDSFPKRFLLSACPERGSQCREGRCHVIFLSYLPRENGINAFIFLSFSPSPYTERTLILSISHWSAENDRHVRICYEP